MERKVKILFLAANPTDTSQLRLGEETNAIDEELLKARFRDNFDLEQKHAVKAEDLSQHLLQIEPDIVHFSGHGSRTGEIYLEDVDGKSHPVSESTLSNLFSVLKGNIRCVVLNACFSEKQAMAISKHVDCVVGMSEAIGDEAAIKFAQGFYRGIGYGKNVEESFNLGCAQIDLQNLEEEATPRILWKNNHPIKINFNQLTRPSVSSIKQTKSVSKNKVNGKTKKGSFWKTLPGILAVIAVVIIAATGLIVGFSGMFAQLTPTPQPTPTPTPTPTPQPAAAVPSVPDLTWPPDDNKYYLTLPITEETRVPIKLEWKPVREADYYEVKIYYDSDPFGLSSENSTKLYRSDFTQINSFEFNAIYIFSRHWWFVRSANNNGESPWSEVRSFYFQTPPP